MRHCKWGVSGDMDGDITTQPELVEFLRFTKPWVDKRNWEDQWLQLFRDVVDLG